MSDLSKVSFRPMPDGARELSIEIDRVQKLYDDLYGDDPGYGNGPLILQDLLIARQSLSDGIGIHANIDALRGITRS